MKRCMIGFILIQMLTFSSCSDDESMEIVKPKGHLETHVVTNLISGAGSDDYSDIADPIYYNLEENKIVDKALAQTSQWDIELSGAFNTSIKPNNKHDKHSAGYQGAGTSEIFLYKDPEVEADYFDETEIMPKRMPERALSDKVFDNLSEVPAENEMVQMSEIGLNQFMSAQEDGWCFYDMGGLLFPEAGPEKHHVIYALPRCIIVKTNKGNYVKLIMQSIYQNNPENPDRSHKPGYINFKYTIQKNGTTGFTN
ncbi:HmuY family protein [Rapidithrix thailandica]|uniref:HmuY family protein n=1 Tax=Rapidithrix thailandica TaxID=413964 RepID=A0AAW9RZP6_9BACT